MRRFVVAVSNRLSLPRSAMALSLLMSTLGVAQAQPLQVAAADVQTQSCRFVGRVNGYSGYGKNSGWQGIAKGSALAQAEKLGATAVVWENFTPVGAFNGSAVAKAYLCDTRQTQVLLSHAQ